MSNWQIVTLCNIKKINFLFFFVGNLLYKSKYSSVRLKRLLGKLLRFKLYVPLNNISLYFMIILSACLSAIGSQLMDSFISDTP